MSSTMTMGHNRQPDPAQQEQNMNGAAIIDADGREIPITEEMILAALKDLEADRFQSAYAGQHQLLPA